MDRNGRWTKEDIPKLREIKKDQEQVEKLKKEKKWCDPDQYELLLKCSEKKDISEWNKMYQEQFPYLTIWLQRVFLKNSYIKNADIRNAHFEDSYLVNTVLENANLMWIKLKDSIIKETSFVSANLQFAILENTTLDKVNFENADLRFSDLNNSRFEFVHFVNSDLRGAHIESSSLTESNLKDVKLWGANLRNSDLSSSNLKNTDLQCSNLINANICNSNLENANLYSANLEKTHLRNSNLKNTNLVDSILYNTDFYLADIRGANLDCSKVGTYSIYSVRDSNANNITHNTLVPLESTDFKDVRYNRSNLLLFWMLHVAIWFLSYLLFRITGLYKVKCIPIFQYKKMLTIRLPFKRKLHPAILHLKDKTEKTSLSIGFPFIKKLKKKTIYNFPSCKHYLKTSFIGVDTTDVDWSKNPQLKRDIHNQQYLHDLKTRNKKNPLFWGLYFLWWVTSDCGDSILRWMFWSGVFAVFFAGLFAGWFTYENGVWEQPKLHYQTYDMLYEKKTGQTNPNIAEPDFCESLYYSVVTFTTLGFGDVVPVNASGRWAVMFEVILGYIMLGGLISLFANKFVRRE